MAKKSGNSSSALQEKALDLIGSRDSGLFQSELRRLLSVDSSRCSKIVSRLRGLGLICREKVPGQLHISAQAGQASCKTGLSSAPYLPHR